MNIKRLIALALCLMCLSLCAIAEEQPVPAPDFTVLDAEGNQVRLSDLMNGKPMVLNFWASWCPPCVGELPHFEAAAKQYEGEVVFMMINLTDGVTETYDGAKEFIASNGYTFPSYFDTLGEGMSLFVGQYVPITWFVNADGTLLGYMEGAMDADTLEQCIQLALGN